MSLSDVSLIVASAIISIGLLTYGYFAVFRSRQLSNFNIKLIKGNNPKPGLIHLEKMAQKKWFYTNMKICGMGAILMACLFLYFMIHGVLNLKY
jgi:hypothetical protein